MIISRESLDRASGSSLRRGLGQTFPSTASGRGLVSLDTYTRGGFLRITSSEKIRPKKQTKGKKNSETRRTKVTEERVPVIAQQVNEPN